MENKIKKKLLGKLNFIDYISLLIMFFSLCIPFFAGKFFATTSNEMSASNITQVVKNNTNSKKRLGVIVKKKDKENLPDSEAEFLATYGVFNQTQAMFGSGFNFNKDSTVYFSSLGEPNFSVFYSGACASIPYNNHFKQITYPFELMFQLKEFSYYAKVSNYILYISKSQADYLLSSNPETKKESGYTESDYEKLITNPITATVNGNDVLCVIANVYLETNYYYDAFKEVLNDFVICSYYFANGYIDKELLYFFSDYNFQNRYMISYLNTVYADRNVDLNLCKGNLINAPEESRLLDFYYSRAKESSVIGWLLAVLSFVLALSSAVIIVFKKTNESILFYILLLLFSATAYIIFQIIYLSTNSIVYFSNTGILIYVIVLVAIVVSHLAAIIIKKKVRNQRKGITQNETIDI